MTPPVQSITVVLADQRMEPFRPDVEITYDAVSGRTWQGFAVELVLTPPARRVLVAQGGIADFHREIGCLFLDGFRRLVSLSTVVDDSDYETPLEKDSAMSATRRNEPSS